MFKSSTPLLEDQDILLLVLLLLAIAVGWVLGRYHSKQTKQAKAPLGAIPRDYFVGLNYLINEQPDRATDVFVKMLEVNSDTVEAHLALGHLFCRKGEVEKAIRLHQNVIARPSLSSEQRSEALLALATDYFKAGLFDRAERLFSSLAENKQQLKPSLLHLIRIYEQQKDWFKAIDCAQQLQQVSDESKKPIISHYYCELAEQALQKGDWDFAQRCVSMAFKIDKTNARVTILQGALDIKRNRFKEALRVLKQVKYQDITYLPECIDLLKICYEKLGYSDGLYQYLFQCLDEKPGISVVLALANEIALKEGLEPATRFMEAQLHERLSLKGLYRLLEFKYQAKSQGEQDDLAIVKNFMHELLESKPVYQCTDCGLASKLLYWQCPKCNHWSSVKPIQGLEGE